MEEESEPEDESAVFVDEEEEKDNVRVRHKRVPAKRSPPKIKEGVEFDEELMWALVKHPENPYTEARRMVLHYREKLAYWEKVYKDERSTWNEFLDIDEGDVSMSEDGARVSRNQNLDYKSSSP